MFMSCSYALSSKTLHLTAVHFIRRVGVSPCISNMKFFFKLKGLRGRTGLENKVNLSALKKNRQHKKLEALFEYWCPQDPRTPVKPRGGCPCFGSFAAVVTKV